MVEETTFQHALDREPTNSALRMVFADWLEEQGDPRALGYRWMGEHEKWPFDWSQRDRVPIFRAWSGRPPVLDTFDWYLEDGGASWEVPRHCQLPFKLRELFKAQTGWLDYPTRREAEQALCRVLYLDFTLSVATRATVVAKARAWRARPTKS